METDRLTRRRALGWLGGLGLAIVIPGCTDDESETSAAGTTTTPETSPGATASPDCILTPELTEGPYYLDLDLMRRDIREGRPGLTYDLAVKVVDAESCEPIEDAVADVWHCDAEGVYSGVEGDDETFLRGIQVTDGTGTASFRTIFPGWYTGRAVHIHLKVIQGGETWTGQLFFDEGSLETVYSLRAYSSRGAADTPNESDGIFQQSGGSTVVATVLSGTRASSQVTIGVERA